jgi:hypothetical protein
MNKIYNQPLTLDFNITFRMLTEQYIVGSYISNAEFRFWNL